MCEEKIFGLIIAGLMFVYGIFRAIADIMSMRDSTKRDTKDSEGD